MAYASLGDAFLKKKKKKKKYVLNYLRPTDLASAEVPTPLWEEAWRQQLAWL